MKETKLSCKVLQKSADQTLETTATCLSQGGVVLVPTDTVYGLIVSPIHGQSVDRLFTIKSRPNTVNLPIMVAGEKQLKSLGAHISSDAARLLESNFVPGALTLVFGLDSVRVPQWLSGRFEIAVRVPDDPFLLALLEKTGPFLATSANKHGRETPSTVDLVLDQLDLRPDLAIDGGEVDTVPSTLVNCNIVPARIERVGVISGDQIGNILNGQ